MLASCVLAVLLIAAGTVGSWLIAARLRRRLDPRTPLVAFDDDALTILRQAAATGRVRLITLQPTREGDGMPGRGSAAIHSGEAIFLEVIPRPHDAYLLVVEGTQHYGYQVLRVTSTHVAPTIAAVLLGVRDVTATMPHIGFAWPERSHAADLLRFLLSGTGYVAPLTPHILRQAEPSAARRPKVHIA